MEISNRLASYPTRILLIALGVCQARIKDLPWWRVRRRANLKKALSAIELELNVRGGGTW